MEESLKFYQEILGLKVNRRFPAGPNQEIAFLGEGGTEIELICSQGTDKINVGEDISWGFEVDSLDDAMQLVKEKGLEILSGPFQPNPSTRFFYLLDPNGFKIQIAEILKNS